CKPRISRPTSSSRAGAMGGNTAVCPGSGWGAKRRRARITCMGNSATSIPVGVVSLVFSTKELPPGPSHGGRAQDPDEQRHGPEGRGGSRTVRPPLADRVVLQGTQEH